MPSKRKPSLTLDRLDLIEYRTYSGRRRCGFSRAGARGAFVGISSEEALSTEFYKPYKPPSPSELDDSPPDKDEEDWTSLSDAGAYDDDAWTLVHHEGEGDRTWASVVSKSRGADPGESRGTDPGEAPRPRAISRPARPIEVERHVRWEDELPEPVRIRGGEPEPLTAEDPPVDHRAYGPSAPFKDSLSQRQRYWRSRPLRTYGDPNAMLGRAERSCIRGLPRARDLRKVSPEDLDVAKFMMDEHIQELQYGLPRPGSSKQAKQAAQAARKALDRQRQRVQTVMREHKATALAQEGFC